MAKENKKPSDDEKKDKNTVKKNNVSDDSSSNLSENNDASKEKKTEKNEPQACSSKSSAKKTEKNEPQACSSKSSAPTSSSSETSSHTTPQCDSTSSSKNIEENTSSKSIKKSFNYCRPQKPKDKEKAGPSSYKDWTEYVQDQSESFDPVAKAIKKENLDYMQGKHFGNKHFLNKDKTSCMSNDDVIISGSEDDSSILLNVNTPEEEPNEIGSTFRNNLNEGIGGEQESFDPIAKAIKKENLDYMQDKHFGNKHQNFEPFILDIKKENLDYITSEDFPKDHNDDGFVSGSEDDLYMPRNVNKPQEEQNGIEPTFKKNVNENIHNEQESFDIFGIEIKKECLDDLEGSHYSDVNIFPTNIISAESGDRIFFEDNNSKNSSCDSQKIFIEAPRENLQMSAFSYRMTELSDCINSSSDEPPSKKARRAQEDIPNIEGINDDIVHNITESTSSSLFNNDVPDYGECDHEKLKQPQVVLYDVLSENCDKNFKKILSNSDRKILRNFYKKFKAINSKKRITRASAKNTYNNNDITNRNALLSVHLPEIPSLNKRKINKPKFSNETKTKKASSPPQSLFSRMSELFSSKKGFYCTKCHCNFVSALMYKKHPCCELQHRLKACVVKLERVPEKSTEYASDQSANQADILSGYICKCENKKCNSNEDDKPCVRCMNEYFFPENEHSSQTDDANSAYTYRTDVPSTSSTDVQEAVSIEEAASLLEEVSWRSLLAISSNDETLDALLSAFAFQIKK